MRNAKKEAFEAFDRGQRPSQLSIRGVKRSTLYRYHQLWKRLRGSPPSLGGTAISPAGQDLRQEVGGILNRYEEFLRLQKLDIRKGEVLGRVEALKASLKEADEQYLGQGVQIEGWQRRRQLYGGRLGWIAREIDAARSEAALTDLQALLTRAYGEISALHRELGLKLVEKEQLQRKREAELSCNLLRRVMDDPLFPGHVRKAVERTILVRDMGEAEAIFQALCQWEIVHDTAGAGPARMKQVWDAFVAGLEAEGWDFIKRLKQSNDGLRRRMQVRWGSSLGQVWFGAVTPAIGQGWRTGP